MNNTLYHYQTSWQNCSGLFQGQFFSIIETIEKVYCTTMTFTDPVIPDVFNNDFIRARLFNQDYDIVITPESTQQFKAVILTEKTLSIDTKKEYSVLDAYEISNFVDKSPLLGKKYICKSNPDETKVGENVSFIKEKYIVYRLMEIKNGR